MSRAQEIRQKRLNERKAEQLFDWVLDMFEHPTANNTADEVYLRESHKGKIQIGYDNAKGLTDKPFDRKVMEQLVGMFEEEDGYNGAFWSDNNYYKVIIRIL